MDCRTKRLDPDANCAIAARPKITPGSLSRVCYDKRSRFSLPQDARRAIMLSQCEVSRPIRQWQAGNSGFESRLRLRRVLSR